MSEAAADALSVVRSLDPGDPAQVGVRVAVRPGAAELREVFDAASAATPRSNDTSIGVGFAPFSPTESLALDEASALGFAAARVQVNAADEPGGRMRAGEPDRSCGRRAAGSRGLPGRAREALECAAEATDVMAARKKKSSRKTAPERGGKKAGKRKTGKKKGGRARAATRKTAGRRKKRARKSPSLADRLTHLVEDLAAGALRRVVDTGGRELAGWLPEAPEMRREAGEYVRELREVAGLTIDELADAVELRDRSVLEAVEQGTATLSFELILRLAAVLARHDPVPFVAHLLRSYNPVLWQLLDDWGVGRLPLQLERERQFVNVLRGHDGARALSDEDFERVLGFTRSAFETAMHFADPSSRTAP